jgi:hypothetical protein
MFTQFDSPVGSLFGAQPNSRADTVTTAGKAFQLLAPKELGKQHQLQNLTQSVVDSYRPYPLYNSLSAKARFAFANYNGLQLKLRSRASGSRECELHRVEGDGAHQHP